MKNKTQIVDKRSKISQTEIPNLPLEQSLRVAKAIWENFAGKGSAPHNIAMSLDLSPTSGGWRNLCGASIAYGLTEGGYNANAISLTELGRRIVAPTQEGDDEIALQEAALKPRIPGEFFRQYNRAKFPRDDIAANVLVEKGLPKDRASDLVRLIKENGGFVGFIKETKTGPFVSLDVAETARSPQVADDGGRDGGEMADTPPSFVAPSANISIAPSAETDARNNRVFISHGKNRDILEQIKEVVELGGFQPVVSVQVETVAKPIPEKVLDDMRSCSAAVIHVGSEGVLMDDKGAEHPQINANVLIEIGAAMALYKGRFILVIQDGVPLPSNLQGLYESRYSGNALALQAGMRILKALRGLKAETT